MVSSYLTTIVTSLAALFVTGSLATADVLPRDPRLAWRLPYSNSKVHTRAQGPDLDFSDNTCDLPRQAVITKAFHNAIAMSKNVVESSTNFSTDYAFLDLFGPKALQNLTAPTILQPFTSVTTASWKLHASCTIIKSTDWCSSPSNFGGAISIEASIRDGLAILSMMFCDEFFQMPPLDARIDNPRGSPVGRVALSEYYKNHATTLLGELIRHVSSTQNQGLNQTRLIMNRWIYTYALESEDWMEITHKWIACYGANCARLLARLDDNGNFWSTRNAPNYALFALAKFIEPFSNNIYPYHPMVDHPSLGSARPLNGSHEAPCLVNIDKLAESENIYDKRSSGFTFQSILDDSANVTSTLQTIQTDITQARYLSRVEDFPDFFNSKRQQYLEESATALKGQLVNYAASARTTCYSVDSTILPDSVFFTRTELIVDFVNTFCNVHIKNGLAKNIVPAISLGPGTATTGDILSINSTAALSADGAFFFSLTANQSYAAPGFAVSDAFDGSTPDEKISHCTSSFVNLIDSCDSGTQKRGGSSEMNGRILTVYAALISKIPLLIDMSSSFGTAKCVDMDAVHLWRIPVAANGTDPTKWCTCWFDKYPNGADVFCKPAGGCQQLEQGRPDISSGAQRTCV